MRYILRLFHGKYFVGSSDNVRQTIMDHFTGLGSQWTNIHKVIEVIRVDNGDVDQEVIRMMKLHGIENVRGGRFENAFLSGSQLSELHSCESKPISDRLIEDLTDCLHIF